MIEELIKLEKQIPEFIKENKFINSYTVDWVDPIEYRLWMQIDNYRLSLQKFLPGTNRPYLHNHPWPKAMKLVSGSLKQILAYDMYPTDKRIDSPAGEHIRLKNYTCSEMILKADNYFTVEIPELYHSIEPLEDCYMIMLTGHPFFKGPKSPNDKIEKVPDNIRKEIEEKILNSFIIKK